LRTKDGSNAYLLSVSFHLPGGLENGFAVPVVRIVCSLVTIMDFVCRRRLENILA
jgi:hypothetical protein